MIHSGKDTLYSTPDEPLEPFKFDENVARVFADMIHRSVPGYQVMVDGIAQIAAKFITQGSQCYDLGCSLANVTLAIRRKPIDHDYRIIAIDNSKDMIQRARALLDAYKSQVAVELYCQDIQQTHIENASVVILNFTLQFIDPSERLALISTIYQGLNENGVLIISEKINCSSTALNDLLIDLHHDFKRQNGYSELEISQKRSALENVLIPDTILSHKERLNQAGFRQVDVWYQHFNFCSLIAIK